MSNNLNRRDFLKLASLLPASLYIPKSITTETKDQPNIVVIVFDAWSASNTSLYGYPRKTTPNIDRMAENAIVYHNHYASGHYTYPSTASLLTGVLPWEHKGYWNNAGEKILDEYATRNIFHYLPEYQRSAYSHNGLADGLLGNMVSGIDTYLPKNALSLLPIKWYDNLFKKDWDISSLSWIKNLQIHDNGFSNSLFLSRIYNQIRSAQLARYAEEFPRGVPAQTKRDNFLLETAIDWVTANLEASPEPFFSYIHMLPPHSPYRTRRDFVDRFLADGYQPIKKPHHIFGQKPITYQEQTESRRIYDEYLLYVDSEFQRLMDNLSRRGILENTIVILTSDHGEMFERGIPEHLDPSFHRPVMHIPLIIFPPGQSERVDIHSLTTTVDLLPTILHLTGNTAASLLEGEILPPFNPADQSNRTIFSVDFRHSYKSKKLTNGTIMICSKEYKFTYLFGTEGRYAKLPESVLYELFDISRDPEEMKNLYDPQDPLSQMFLKIMEEKLAEKKLELVRYD